MKVNTFSLDKLKLFASVPLNVKVNSSSSGSSISILATKVLPSVTSIIELIFIVGASFSSFIVTLTRAVEVFSPCVIV